VSKKSGEPLKIAIIQPTTGPDVTADGSLYAPLRFAISEINEQGGVLGMPIQTKTFNDEGEPALEASIAEEIVSSGYHYVFGPFDSSQALASYAITQKHDIIQVGGTQAAKLVDPTTYPGVFCSNMISPFFTSIMLDNFVNVQGKRRVALMYEDAEYGTEGHAAVTSWCKGSSASLVSAQIFEQGAPSFLPNLQHIANADADCLLLWVTSSSDLAAIYNAIQEVNFDGLIGGTTSYTSTLYRLMPTNYPTAILNNTRLLAPKSLIIGPDQPLPASITQYTDKLYALGTSPPIGRFSELVSTTVIFYDFMYILQGAIERAGTLDYQSVLTQLQTMPKYPGIVVSIQFTAQNHVGLDPSDFVLAKPAPVSMPNSGGGVFPTAA
jgi:branched-chain amino acid transport system substrate-binding protein